MTAGIATNSPTAVAINASEIPAMTLPLASAMLLERSRKARMIPRTVPNNPMKGALLPTVARKFSQLAVAQPFLGLCTLEQVLDRLGTFLVLPQSEQHHVGFEAVEARQILGGGVEISGFEERD